MTSNPCYNGGTCLPRDNEQNRRRFDCKCQDGYTGYRCQKPIRSCRGYSDGNRVAGKYKIFDINMMRYEVFCDFENSTMTWTLVQSNQRDQKMKALSYDNPLNQNNFSWNAYRLSKTKMESIHEDSTMWRATCQYQEQSCSDLVRGFNDKMDILRNTNSCVQVEYINIRGHSCTNCTVYFLQSDRCRFHFHLSTNWGSDCKSHPLWEQYRTDLDYFDCYHRKYIYGDQQDKAHCCSKSSATTTQIWFGGHWEWEAHEADLMIALYIIILKIVLWYWDTKELWCGGRLGEESSEQRDMETNCVARCGTTESGTRATAPPKKT